MSNKLGLTFFYSTF